MRNLGGNDWASSGHRIVHIKFSSFSKPAEFKVRKFKPIEGVDITDKAWHDSSGGLHFTPLPPYAFRDIYEAADAYRRYLGIYMLQALDEFVNDEGFDRQVRRTYGLM